MGELIPQPHGGALYRPNKGETANPNGMPKGTKHIATWIQEMLNDEDFETILLDSKKGALEYKGAPLKAIIKVAIHKAIHDKEKGNVWAEWLAKHGYGTKLDVTSGGEPIQPVVVEIIRHAPEDTNT